MGLELGGLEMILGGVHSLILSVDIVCTTEAIQRAFLNT